MKRCKNPEPHKWSTENNMDYNKHTKLRIYLIINCMRNREVNTALLSLLINVGL
jgi:hypothetical protein